MNRREFLVRAGVLAAAPIVLQITACGDDDAPATGNQNDRFSFQGTGQGHTHNGEITCTQLNGGVTITVRSSSTSGHTHDVQISNTELATIMSGGTVTITMNTTDPPGQQPHDHSWSISRPAGRC